MVTMMQVGLILLLFVLLGAVWILYTRPVRMVPDKPGAKPRPVRRSEAQTPALVRHEPAHR